MTIKYIDNNIQPRLSASGKSGDWLRLWVSEGVTDTRRRGQHAGSRRSGLASVLPDKLSQGEARSEADTDWCWPVDTLLLSRTRWRFSLEHPTDSIATRSSATARRAWLCRWGRRWRCRGRAARSGFPRPTSTSPGARRSVTQTKWMSRVNTFYIEKWKEECRAKYFREGVKNLTQISLVPTFGGGEGGWKDENSHYQLLPAYFSCSSTIHLFTISWLIFVVQSVPDMQGGGKGEARPQQVQHFLAAGQPEGADPPDRALPV